MYPPDQRTGSRWTAVWVTQSGAEALAQLTGHTRQHAFPIQYTPLSSEERQKAMRGCRDLAKTRVDWSQVGLLTRGPARAEERLQRKRGADRVSGLTCTSGWCRRTLSWASFGKQGAGNPQRSQGVPVLPTDGPQWAGHALRVARCALQVARCRLQVARCRLQVARCTLQVARCRLQVAGCTLHVAGCRLQVERCRLNVAGCRLQVER